jgi:hypothetical protein
MVAEQFLPVWGLAGIDRLQIGMENLVQPLFLAGRIVGFGIQGSLQFLQLLAQILQTSVKESGNGGGRTIQLLSDAASEQPCQCLRITASRWAAGRPDSPSARRIARSWR